MVLDLCCVSLFFPDHSHLCFIASTIRAKSCAILLDVAFLFFAGSVPAHCKQYILLNKCHLYVIRKGGIKELCPLPPRCLWRALMLYNVLIL